LNHSNVLSAAFLPQRHEGRKGLQEFENHFVSFALFAAFAV
jgi:hypothetical protein